MFLFTWYLVSFSFQLLISTHYTVHTKLVLVINKHTGNLFLVYLLVHTELVPSYLTVHTELVPSYLTVHTELVPSYLTVHTELVPTFNRTH